MRLLTHNQLLCAKSGCGAGSFPLGLEPSKVEQEESEFKAEYMVKLMDKLDYQALLQAAVVLGIKGLPSALPDKLTAEQHEPVLRLLQKLVLDIHIQEGALICGKCKRRYVIKKGIPNMRLNEDEVE
eukprot:TRINITY_DN72228_c0_g1_i1.p1 TRINITY_DN72228_c0_g1~~TRINITY_DN72228_c0_g1_i1.p1  ORF type:complete len:127 (+),score=62.95 TRINITY_DN72228_c0_g1_i1:96-476(+)